MTWRLIHLFVDALPNFQVFIAIHQSVCTFFNPRAAVLARTLFEKRYFNINEVFPG